MTDHDFGPAVDRLIDGPSIPPASWGGPPRPLPPRPLPRHLQDPAPRRWWGTDRATTSRRRRYLDVLAHVVRGVSRQDCPEHGGSYIGDEAA